MKKFTLRQSFDMSADEYWKIFFDADFNRKMYREVLGFREYEVVELKGSLADGYERKVRSVPKSDLPAAARAVVGEGISYIEEGQWDPTTKRWSYSLTPSTMPDKVRIEGTYWLEPTRSGGVERVVEVEVEVKVFGLGGLVENFIEKTHRESYEQTANYVRTHGGR